MSRNKITNHVSIILLLISSALILMSNVADYRSNKQIIIAASYLLSLAFWICLITGWVMRYMLFRRLKKNELIKGSPFSLNIFSNIYSIIADVVLLLSIILLALAYIFDFSNIVKTICISLIIFTVQMHFVLNGKVFKYINTISRGENKQ